MKNFAQNKAFWALFGAQLFGSFNDNFFRSAFVTLITFHLVTTSETAISLFVSAGFGLFMVPAFLFSPLAGQLADRYDKSLIIRWVKISEILIVSLSAYGFITKDPYLLLATIFFMGVHTAFFSPVKYSILPDILPEEKVLSGNGYLEAGIFLAIMLGTLGGAVMIHLEISPFLLSFLLIMVALLGLVCSWLIPPIPSRAPDLKIRASWIGEVKRLFRYTQRDERLYKAIIAISWFWLVGTVLLSQLPSFVKDVIRVEENVFIFLLLLFTLGVGIGSLLCNWIFASKITIKHVPLLALLMALLLFDIASFGSPLSDTSLSLFSFLTSFQGLRLTADIFVLSFAGGLFIVPLYAFMQTHVLPSKRSQVIAFNNIINAGFMVFASFASFCLLSLNVSIPTLIFLIAFGQVIVAIYVIGILPDSVFRNFLLRHFGFLFRLGGLGPKNYEK